MTHNNINNNNNQYLNEYIKDLKIWQSEIKKKDSEIKKSKLNQAAATATPKESIAPPTTTTSTAAAAASGNSNSNNNTTSTESKINNNNIIDNTNESIKYKEKGNLLFGQQKYKESIEYYTLGIQLDSTNAVLYGNRAMAYLKLKNFSQAELDSTRCLNLDPTYMKCYHRRGLARIELQKYEDAISDFKHILNQDPSNKDTQNELNKAIKLLKDQKEKEKLNNSNNNDKISNNISGNNNNNNNNNKPIKIQEINNESNSNVNKLSNKIETISDPIIIQSKNTTQTPSQSLSTSSTPTSTTTPITSTKSPITPITPITSVPSSTTTTSKITPIISTTPTSNNNNTTTAATTSTNNNKPLSLSERLSKMSNIKAPVPKFPPKNSFDFERTYHSFKGDLSSLYQYFKLIEPNQIPRILDEALTPTLFTDIIKILEDYYLVNKEFNLIFNILNNILKINRINLNIQFISKDEKQKLASIINSLYNNIDNSIDKSNIDNLLNKYTS